MSQGQSEAIIQFQCFSSLSIQVQLHFYTPGSGQDQQGVHSQFKANKSSQVLKPVKEECSATGRQVISILVSNKSRKMKIKANICVQLDLFTCFLEGQKLSKMIPPPHPLSYTPPQASLWSYLLLCGLMSFLLPGRPSVKSCVIHSFLIWSPPDAAYQCSLARPARRWLLVHFCYINPPKVC